MYDELVLSKKPRRSSGLVVVKMFLRWILMLLDSRCGSYMKLYTMYLKLIGVNVSGRPLYVCADLKIDGADHTLISIGHNTVISSEVRILSHDYAVNKALIHTRFQHVNEISKLREVKISENVFVGMRTLILPGITIGKNSIIGAGSVVTSDVPENCVYAGNPARLISTLDDYAMKVMQEIKTNPEYFYEN